MKAIFVVVLACIAGALASPNPQASEQAKAIIKNGGSSIKQLLPDLNATIVLNETLSITTDKLTNLQGTFSLNNGVLYDLNTVTDDLELNLLTLSVSGNVVATQARVTGQFAIDGTILLNSGSHVVSGSGSIDLTINGVTAVLYVKVRLTALLKVQIQTLTLDPAVLACSGSADGARSDGEQIDVGAICSDIQNLFAAEFAGQGPTLLADIQKLLNEVLIELTLQELIDIIIGLRP